MMSTKRTLLLWLKLVCRLGFERILKGAFKPVVLAKYR
jgi:hypothetical protein